MKDAGSLLWACNITSVVFLIGLFKCLAGILDQGAGVLVVFDDAPHDKTYENTLELIHQMGKVVDALYNKAKKLS